jgi:hypothetical protein
MKIQWDSPPGTIRDGFGMDKSAGHQGPRRRSFRLLGYIFSCENFGWVNGAQEFTHVGTTMP